MVEHKCILDLKKEVIKMVVLKDRSFDQLLEMAAITFQARQDIPSELKKEFIEEFRQVCQRAGLEPKEACLFAMWIGGFALEAATLFGKLQQDGTKEGATSDLPPEGWK